MTTMINAHFMIRLGLVLGLIGCHAKADSVLPGSAARTSIGPAITARVALAPGTAPARTRGTLVVMWLTAGERDAFEAGQLTVGLLRDLVTRAELVGEIDAAHGHAFTVHAPPGRVALHAVIDVGKTGIEALLGGGDGTLTGMSPVFDVGPAGAAAIEAPVISVSGQPSRPPREFCQGDRLTLEHLEAPEVAGTVGNPTSRRFCVRVPAGYADHPGRRYPVIYALPGLHSTDNAVIADYGLDPPDTIVVAVDTSTTTGSTYLVDSATNGAWDTFFTRRLIPYVDAHYRTLARRQARGIVGHSTGGFNAVSFGLRHPELIGAIAASSPDALDLAVWLTEGGAVRPWIRDFARVERGLGGVGQFISYAANWSPTAGGYDWLFDPSGAVVESVRRRWLAKSPREWLRDSARVAAIAPLRDHIYLTVGEHDEFDLGPPTVAFSEALTAVGIGNQLVLSSGGHDGIAEHMAAIVKFLAARLEPASHER
jgi:S-formylglutathione hydrolase FrmB